MRFLVTRLITILEQFCQEIDASCPAEIDKSSVKERQNKMGE